jgi:hypothetical protein
MPSALPVFPIALSLMPEIFTADPDTQRTVPAVLNLRRSAKAETLQRITAAALCDGNGNHNIIEQILRLQSVNFPARNECRMYFSP